MVSAQNFIYAMYFVPMALIWVLYLLWHSKRQKANVVSLENAVNAGLTEPPSLHPLVDVSRCIGCGACAYACPEHDVLGIIDGKVQLINPTHCIGHGACKTACPEDAISLVFGTEKRGVDIPMVAEDFETNVPGLFIAGELGGMGLIRNAVEQGKQAMASIGKLDGLGVKGRLDVVIVGAGPAGIAASLAAMQKNFRFVTVEQDSLGGTVAHFPRGKIVMTAPMQLPLVGKVKVTETTKEELLAIWQAAEKQTGLQINYHERVDEIVRKGEAFEVKTSRGVYNTRAVLLAIGRRGTPRKLGVSGEDLPKVVYRLIDPEQYHHQRVLVVGGGDSALEAATSISALGTADVTLSYRSEAFSRAKEKNRQKVIDEEISGRLRVLMKSQVTKVSDQSVRLKHKDHEFELDNDAVIVCVGGILPTPFLKKIGIDVETKYGTA